MTVHDDATTARRTGPQDGMDEPAPGPVQALGDAPAPEPTSDEAVGPAQDRRRDIGGTGGPEAGMATAEYAIGTVAAAAFAGLLLLILRGDGIRAALEGIIRSALTMG